MVVPLAGTWIEITVATSQETEAQVVPLAGTWIEIQSILANAVTLKSRSPCGNEIGRAHV